MNLIKRFLGAAAFLMLMLSLSSSAMAHRSGGGGGGGGGTVVTEGATLLVFDYVAPVNGKVPTWSGDFSLTPPTLLFYSLVTNLSFSIRAKNLNLPDNSRLFVHLYTSDIATGTQLDTSVDRWHCMSAMQVVGKLGIVKAYNDFYDEMTSPIVRRLDKVVITDANGTILATAHP